MHFGLASSSKEKLMGENERTKGGELGGQRHMVAKVKGVIMGDYHTIVTNIGNHIV